MATIQKRETQTGEARYTVRHYAGRDERGKRRFVFKTFNLLKDAKRHAAKLEAMQGDGVVVSKEPFGRYLDRWLDVKAGMVRARTIHDYRGIVRRYITDPPDGAPPIALIPLDKLKVDAFELLYSWMRETGLAPRTIAYTHTVLRMACKDAVKKRALRSNPTDHAAVPTQSADDDAEVKVVRAMDQDQAERFIAAARADRHSAFWHVLLHTGMRPSEALGLAWSHVDLEAGRIEVQRTLSRVGVKGWRLVPTKTKKSRRSITLPAVAVKELARWRALQGRERLQLGEEYVDQGFVFTTWNGGPLSGVNLSKRNFVRIMQAAGLGQMETVKVGRRVKRELRRFKPAFRVYDLRHTHATLLLKAGVPLKVVSERLGHSSIVLTADTYSSVLPGMQQEVADKLEAMFGG